MDEKSVDFIPVMLYWENIPIKPIKEKNIPDKPLIELPKLLLFDFLTIKMPFNEIKR